MKKPLDLPAIQTELSRAKLDGWLFYDHHHRDAIAYRVLGVEPALVTRRWYYFIPSAGEPSKLVHRIERGNLEGLPGMLQEYSSWQEQNECLAAMLHGVKRVAMQYSPSNAIPYVGLVDAGTVERVRSLGVEVVTSADLVQLFEARWSAEQLASHLEAGKTVHEGVRRGFEAVRRAILAGKTIREYDVAHEIMRLFESRGLTTEGEPLIVAVNANCSNPHYAPAAGNSSPIRRGDLVLLDLFAKCNRPGAVYFDITWMGFVGEEPPAKFAEIFEVVRAARDAAIAKVESSVHAGQPLQGFEVDDAARGVIAGKGYGQYFTHRTGHSIGEDVHGNGANMDNFETHDERSVIPRTCFSIEPGVYLPDFGVRSEVNVYVEERSARVTGEIQQEIVPILAASA